MRTTIRAAVLATVVLLTTAERAEPQVRVAGGFNPYTGRGGTAIRGYNPITGRATQATQTHNAYTGRTTATRTVTNPYTGRTAGAAATYNPVTGRYGYRYGAVQH